jgi:hypothetical protein
MGEMDGGKEFFGLWKEVAKARENGSYTEELRNTLPSMVRMIRPKAKWMRW